MRRMNRTKDRKSKIGATLFALVFAIGFTLGGIVGGVVPAYRQVAGWWQARSYVPVEAQVASAELQQHHGDSTTYRATARFSYRYRDREYQSNRVFLGGEGSDNIDRYHQDIHARLRAARDTGKSVTLWVDPEHPEQSVYDRAMRWRKLLFLLPFATLFPAVGMGAWWAIWYVWFGKQENEADGMPAGGMQVQPEPGAAYLWVFALFWNLLSWPLAGVFLSGGHASGAVWLVALFPLIGLALAGAAIAATLTRWRIGKPELSLARAARPGEIPLQAQIHFHPAFASRLDPARYWHDAVAELKYIHEDRRGEDTRTTTLWQQEVVNTRVLRGAQSLSLQADLPTGLPQAGASQTEDVYYWQVVLKTLGAEVSFKLPQGAVEADRIGGPAPAQAAAPELTDAQIEEGHAKARRLIGWAGLATFLVPAAFMLWEFVPAFFDKPDKAQAARPSEAVRPARYEPAPQTRAEQMARLREKLASGTSPNSADEQGNTLLMQAAGEGDVDRVRLLIESGASVNASTPVDADGMGGRTALIAAIRGDAADVVELLLSAGADAQATSNRFWTPMHYAAYRDAVASIRTLHRHGAPVDQPFAGARGSTPLMIAAQHDRVAAIKLMLELGADPKRQDLHGENACGYARYFKKEAAGRALSCG